MGFKYPWGVVADEMYEATFHIRGGVPYADATADGGVRVELWCNDHCDLLHVRGGTTEAVVGAVADAVGVADVLERGTEAVVVTDECLRPHTEGNVERYLERHDCLLLPPLRYEDGGKLVRVLTLDAANLAAFYEDVRESFEVTVRSKREVDAVAHDRAMGAPAVPSLSARQREAIRDAWADGYYAVPRETTTTELAAAMGVDRRTFEEHLRLAEEKVVGALVEHV
ncbi:helix-turn-helix domain-containing protein [Halorubellus sp. PRR65]|uniref:helix-turn-helix domain-containing protein n=1 Tax=Halorubellus sp. PRR65 TaxID=3098148 RepID=UPI002B25C5AD|nr:helix-turn-helix domain-containing protein [Halorubellus sp. PRR65]